MDNLKFRTNQELVLYNIARALKKVSIKEIAELTGNYLSEVRVRTALYSLERRRLVKRYEKSFGLFLPQIIRIKKIIGNHWETNWEENWKSISEAN